MALARDLRKGNSKGRALQYSTSKLLRLADLEGDFRAGETSPFMSYDTTLQDC